MAEGVPRTTKRAGGDFYPSLPVIDRFSRLTETGLYTPLPEGWVLGLADIVRSTAAIEAGRYKDVNTAAAAVIAAVANKLGHSNFPFVFGGDGASFAVPAEQEPLAREALAAVAAWVRDSFGLELRIALMPVSAIRAEGYDVRVARFAASPDVTYAMFSGGGMAYAEQRLKEGAFAIPPGPPGTVPNLSGLSCSFEEIIPERGLILSLILLPGPKADPAVFGALVAQVLALAEDRSEARRPVPEGGPRLGNPFRNFRTEILAMSKPPGPGFLGYARMAAWRLAAYLILRLGLRIGGFDPQRYRRQLVENTDFRKFDDGLRMTLDCSPALADRLEALLGPAEKEGLARYGLHRQDAALMTCFVPAPSRSDHVHFVDGAMGGYAMAARALKPAP